MVAAGKGAQSGVLIRDAAALERMADVTTIVIDKTGTLTLGKPAVTGVLPAEGFSEADVLETAAALEQASEHPLAAAIVKAAREKNTRLQEVTDFLSHTGAGVSGRIAGREAAIGNARMMELLGVSVDQGKAQAEPLQEQGKTVMFVSQGGKFAGLIAVEDPIRGTSGRAIRNLQDAGLQIVMATGDTARTAQSVASRLGITEVHAEMLPEDKAILVSRLQSEGKVVAVVGDGINDAPALAGADIGVAMGTGTDIAIENAGITLMSGDPGGLVRSYRLATATVSNIKQNLILAFGYNIIGIPVAAGILYPAFGILLSPAIAAAAMSLSSVSVIGNALRLNLVDLDK
jgi:Cu+-exporting ATPase